MTRVILIRHAETEWNQKRRIQGGGSDIPLNQNGRRQVACIVARLKNEPLSAVYSSPLGRALETARPIAAERGLEVRAEPALREIEAGEFEGVLVDDIGSYFSQVLTASERGDELPRMPGGESLEELKERAWQAVSEIIKRHPEGTVAVVSHYFVILAVVCSVLDIPVSRVRRFRLGTASLSSIEQKDGILRLIGFNESCGRTEGRPL